MANLEGGRGTRWPPSCVCACVINLSLDCEGSGLLSSSAKGKRKLLATRTKRSTSCTVYYCSITQTKTFHSAPPPSERAGSVWCCSVLQVSCEHGDTSTLSRLEMVLSCLSYQTRSPVFFLISRFPITSFAIESVFVLKCPGLLDINGSRPSGGLIDS